MTGSRSILAVDCRVTKNQQTEPNLRNSCSHPRTLASRAGEQLSMRTGPVDLVARKCAPKIEEQHPARSIPKVQCEREEQSTTRRTGGCREV